ncbi:hypothetical protein FJZ18_01090 [Candidatus Pacearchaeota archaeon]|nr:hypothetical protein [Candidatus Pacearchaeota archaeon]
MRKKIIIVLSLFFVILGSHFLDADDSPSKVTDDVYKHLGNNDTVDVVIKTKPSKNIVLKSSTFSLSQYQAKATRVKDDLIIVKVTPSELKNLELNPNVEKIEFAYKIKAFLQNSRAIVNSTASASLGINNVNLTGVGETVCVIDTGINFTHSDLIGKNKTACIVDCLNKNCAENCTLIDDNGHGTHVAGIVAANGTLKGVAPDANLIGVRVLNASGEGHHSNAVDDLTNAINWCKDNRNNYSISVITMSLGTSDLFQNYCDADLATSWTRAINNATAHNISVIAATGNSGNNTAISAPACIQNATSVSSVSKVDSIASYSNYNNLTDLFAPGGLSTNSATLINSTCISSESSNGYCGKQGTSMATPHVAGAVALIKQFYRSQTNGGNATRAIIENALKIYGKNITVPAGYNISRIDIYSAIISLDAFSPNVTLVSPSNATASLIINQTFLCNATDLAIKNGTFYLWNSTSSIYNQTSMNLNGSAAVLQINVTNISSGTYVWNCLFTDENNNKTFASLNNTLTISGSIIDLVSPAGDLFTNTNQTYVCNVSSSLNISNVTFYLWNVTSSEINVSFTNISGTSSSKNFSINFTSEGVYSWNCLFKDTSNNGTFATSNKTITYDITKPVINITLPLNGSYYNAGRFNITLNENSSCLYSLDHGTKNYSMSSINNRTFNATNLTLVHDRNYNVTYYCNDTAGNSNSTFAGNFTIDLSTPNVTLLSPVDSYAETASSTTLNLIFNVTDNLNLSSCSLIIGGSVNSTNSTFINQTLNQSFQITFGAGSYTWNVNCTDIAQNTGNSNSRTITISAPVSSSSGGGGGGGGGDGGGTGASTFSPSQDQVSRGFTQEVKKEDKIKFNIFDEKAVQHTLIVETVSDKYVNITIRSEPINFLLGAGQSIKLNLTSPSFYNLYIKVENITNGKASLTVQTINEPIAVPKVEEKTNSSPITEVSIPQETNQTAPPSVTQSTGISGWTLFWGIFISAIIASLIVYLIDHRKKTKSL